MIFRDNLEICILNLDYSRVEANPPHPNINGCKAQRMQFGWLGRVGSHLPQILCNEVYTVRSARLKGKKCRL